MQHAESIYKRGCCVAGASCEPTRLRGSLPSTTSVCWPPQPGKARTSACGRRDPSRLTTNATGRESTAQHVNLQEVVGSWSLGWYASCFLRSGLKNLSTHRAKGQHCYKSQAHWHRAYLELPVKVLVQLEYCRNVATAVAVVGGRPHCDESFIEHHLEAFHDQLVRTADEVQAVHRVELV